MFLFSSHVLKTSISAAWTIPIYPSRYSWRYSYRMKEFSDDDIFKDENGNFKDIEDWRGSLLNDEGKVSVISFFETFGEGTLDFEAIPECVIKVSIADNPISGEVSWEKLFNKIQYISLCDVNLSGSVDLTAIPRGLYVFSLQCNDFSGTLDFNDLPKELVCLDLYGNKFTGRLDLRPIKELTAAIDDYFYLDQSMPKPLSSKLLGLALYENLFEGNIFVHACG